MSNEFLDRMNKRLTAQGITGRQDLELHDAQVVETGRAVRVLATYSSLYGPPSVHDIKHWVESRMAEFSQDVIVRTDTIHAYPEKDFVTFILEQKVLRQPLTSTAGMTKAGADQYLDGDGTLWEVVKAEQGPSYLMRRDGTPIERMIEVRKQALQGGMSARKHVTLAAVDSIPSAGGGYADVSIGDTVDFYNGGMINRGVVKSAGSSGVKVQVTGRKDSFTIDPQAITSVVEKGPGAEKETDNVQRSYFALIYPGNPKMTEIISPTSSAPIVDPRPLKVEPIESVSGSATPKAETPTGPTRRVLGKLP